MKNDNENKEFSKFAKKWLLYYKKDSGIRTSTFIESYERTITRYLAPRFGKMELDEITPLEIRMFITEMSERYSKSTISKMVICLNQIFKAAVENKLCDMNPAANIHIHSDIVSDEREIYTADEVKRIIENSNNHPNGLYIHILLELGLRCSELCGLKWNDIDYKNRIVYIKRACTAEKGLAHIDRTKNKSSFRILPISSVLHQRLQDEARLHQVDEYVAPSRRNAYKPLTPSSFTKGYYNAFFESSKIRRLSPHCLRHTCGTLLYERCHDIYAVSKFMGHSSINITSKLYVHPDAEILRNALGIN